MHVCVCECKGGWCYHRRCVHESSARTAAPPSLTCKHLYKADLPVSRPIAEPTILIPTRGPHSAVALQYHAVGQACRDRLGACAHDRWRNRVGGGTGGD